MSLFKRKKSFPGEEGSDGTGRKAADNKSGLCGFYYSFDGSIGGNNYHYTVKKDKDTFVFEYESMLHRDYGVMKTLIDDSVMRQLYELYLSCRIAEWDGYSKYNTMVCDGSGFSLSLSFNDGARLNASGTNAFPDRYREFTDGMESVLGSLCNKLLAEARQKVIEKGISCGISSIIVFYKQYGDSGSDEYKFVLAKSDVRSSNYEVGIKSKSGQFYPIGEYNAYKAVPDEYIPLAEIRDLIVKYDLIKWYDHRGSDPDRNNREWYQISVRFEDGTSLNSSGTVYLDNYEEFRNDFLQIMAKAISKIENELK